MKADARRGDVGAADGVDAARTVALVGEQRWADHRADRPGDGTAGAQVLAVAAAATALALGVVVLVGWYAHEAALVQAGTDRTPAQPNTALGLALAGVATIALVRRARGLTLAAGSLVVVVGVLSLLEDVLDRSLIDSLLVDPFLVVGDGAPGRPAPNTSIGLVLLGLALLALLRRPVSDRVAGGVVTAASIVAALACVALFGYAVDLPSAYGWGELTAMAPHAALGLLLLAGALVAVTASVTRDGFVHLVPMPIGVGGLTLVILLWRALVGGGDVDGHVQVSDADRAVLFIGLVVAVLFAVALRLALVARQGQHRTEALLVDLRTSERRLADFLDHAKTAAYTKDLDGRYLMVNAEWLHMVGRSRAEVLGRTTAEVLGDAVAAADITRHDRQVIETGEPVEFEERVRLRGSEHVLLSARFPLFDANGDLYGVAGTSTDITDRVRKQETLRLSEARFRAVIDGLHEGVIVRSGEGEVVIANARVGAMLGVDPELLLGRNASSDWSAVHDDGTPFAGDEDPLMLAMDDGEPVDDVVMGVARPDGTMVWLDVSARRLPPAEPGGPPQGLVSLHDITDLRAQRKELEQRATELERSNEELAQFAYIASHDLSEPLRSIGGFTSLLSQRYAGRLDDEAEEFIGFIVAGVNQMQSLINDLLAFSRVDTQAKTPEPVDSAQVARASLARLHDAIERTGAEIEIGDLPTVAADANQLAQVFQNLVANAIVYRAEGESPRIALTAERCDDAWCFTVTDNGIGVEPRHRERIFRMFQRLNTREEFAGSGIGLAICKKIVERHGGRIWVEGEPGDGSRFRFTIPDRDPEVR